MHYGFHDLWIELRAGGDAGSLTHRCPANVGNLPFNCRCNVLVFVAIDLRECPDKRRIEEEEQLQQLQPQQQPRSHSSIASVFVACCAMDLTNRLLAEHVGDGGGSIGRPGMERRLRQKLRHERTTVAMALAEIDSQCQGEGGRRRDALRLLQGD